MGRSWQDVENLNCIGRKYIDKSIFKYGVHIPIDHRKGFLDNIKNNSIELGKAQSIKLIFDDNKFDVEIRNINRVITGNVNENSQTIQIRYDSNKRIKEYLKNKFNYTYNLIENGEKNISTEEYIEFYMDEEMNTFNVRYNVHSQNILDTEAQQFIDIVKTTSMSKSYKIPLLWAFYNNGNIKLKIDEDDIYNSFRDFYSKEENGIDLESSNNTQDYKNWGKKEYVRLAKNAPIKYLSEGTGEYFYKEDNLFCISDKLNKYINNKEFINEFKKAIQGLEDKYYKRERKKESDEIDMNLDNNLPTSYWVLGHNYEDENMLQDFKDNNVIGIGFFREDLSEYIDNKEKIEKLIEEKNDTKAKNPIMNFLSMRKGDLVALKSCFTKGPRDNSISVIRVSAIARITENPTEGYKYDEHLGHTLPVEWLSTDIVEYEKIAYMQTITKMKNQKIIKTIFGEFCDIEFEEDESEKDDIMLNDTITINEIESYIHSKGYNYSLEQLSNLYLSLKTKPFVILAGISGTGKSKIVRLLAESLGATSENRQFNIISVRPDWNDSSELIGYKNLNDQFIEGHLTKIIKKAIQNKNKPYFVCLDEMNLARVEYYLSDYLSIIESRKNNGYEIITDALIEESSEVDKLYIPENLYLIGTVNMDDTTFTFSRKVLDRANTIEFSDVDLENLFNENEGDEIYPLNISNTFLKTTYLKTIDIEEEHREYAKQINKKIIDINEILKKSQRQFAYRVRDEILFYMIENKKSELLDEDLAFDYQIMQKILPAISGSERSIGDVLVNLFNYVCGKEVISDIDIEEAESYLAKESVKYKNSAEKIIYMLRGYENDGYSSYWY